MALFLVPGGVQKKKAKDWPMGKIAILSGRERREMAFLMKKGPDTRVF